MRSDYEKEITLAVMKWHGWGSPVGLSIFFLSMAVIVCMVKRTFF